MALDSKHLRAFLVVADTHHFGQAAERMGIAQSALSTQIRRLEDIIGGPLFSRGRRSAVTMTPAGRAFLVEATETIARLDRTERIGRLAVQGEAGTMTVGYVFSAAMSGTLSQLLSIVSRRFPHMTINASPMETPEQIAALADARIDACLIRPRRQYPDGIQSQIVHTEPLLLALGHEHPLAASAEVHARDLANEIFLIPQAGEATGWVSAVSDLAQRARFPMPAIRETSDFVTAASMAASGRTVVLAPRSLSNMSLPGIVYRPIAGCTGTVDLALAWREPPTPAIAAVRHALPDLG